MQDAHGAAIRTQRDKVSPSGGSSEHAQGSIDADALKEAIELLFFAYRDFTHEADIRLADHGFGRAHHRVIYFVTRHPGMSVAELLEILKITKQSLGRVLKQLVDDGYIAQQQGNADRRQRLLYPTDKGRLLAQSLTELQMRRIQNALGATGERTWPAVRAFLTGMISEEHRTDVDALLKTPVGPANAARQGGTPGSSGHE